MVSLNMLFNDPADVLAPEAKLVILGLVNHDGGEIGVQRFEGDTDVGELAEKQVPTSMGRRRRGHAVIDRTH
jgi:hypothetical protein